MITHQHLSAYTPSNMDAETLEAMFVQRHKLLESSVKWVTESVTTDKKNHLLFVGPRGSGKTHLVSMIINRLKENENTENTKVIWLGEDDVVMNLADLALLIIRKMAQRYPDAFNTDCLAIAKGKKADDVAEIILDDIKKQAGNDTLLIVKENLSDVFAGLKDAGQKKLRAYLQENHHISILGTSQKLFDAISNRKEAFWGFFDVHHLLTLSVDDASQLISNIAKINQNDDLVNFLATAQGKYRIRALHYLAGGNHRLYVELASFLTMESLDDFVMAITQLADHLTPYFQERIRSLSPQQARIIQKLCELSGAIQVKVIAEELFLEERTVASQLKALKDTGYVISHKRGRASYYEVAEPLLRLSLEVKNSRGEPLKIIASLFRAWFSDEKLKQHLNSSDAVLKSYSKKALEQNEVLLEVRKLLFSSLNTLNEPYDQSNLELVNQILCSPNISKDEKAWVYTFKAMAEYDVSQFDKTIKSLNEVINLGKTQSYLEAVLVRGSIYYEVGKFDEAMKDIDIFLKESNTENVIVLETKIVKSIFFLENESYDNALILINEVINSKIDDLNIRAKALVTRSKIFISLKNTEKSFVDLTKVLKMKGSIESKTLNDALLTLSAYFYVKNDISETIRTLENFLENNGENGINFALFTMPFLHYLKLDIKSARDSLKKAFSEVDKSDELFAFNLNYILMSISKLGSSVWKEELNFIVGLIKQNNIESKLTSAIIQSIYTFISNDSLLSSFKFWIEIWEEISRDLAQIQPAIQALKVSAEALEAGNDKPLFALPKEIRELILPMFEGKFKE